jgi:hypothetical protein
MKIRNIKILINNTPKILLFLVSITVSGQNSKTVSLKSAGESGNNGNISLTSLQIAFLRNIYSEKIEVPKELINGKEYEPYYVKSEVKPLLFPLRDRTASIITRTRRYNNLTLQYDTYLDEVIYTDTSRTINFRFPQIALNRDILEGFNLYFDDDSLIFRNFRLPEWSERNLREGFYEVVYEGKSSYIIRHESSYYERQGLSNYKYSPKNFISTGQGFYKIKSMKSLLSLFGDNAVKMKEFIHSSGIRIKKANKNEISSIIKYYDSL